jgi:hypothetical protein
MIVLPLFGMFVLSSIHKSSHGRLFFSQVPPLAFFFSVSTPSHHDPTSRHQILI